MMELIIKLPENAKEVLDKGAWVDGSLFDIALREALNNSIPVADKLKQIREEIKSTYYSQGDGFDDFPHGYMFAKDEDMKILDNYIQMAGGEVRNEVNS